MNPTMSSIMATYRRVSEIIFKSPIVKDVVEGYEEIFYKKIEESEIDEDLKPYMFPMREKVGDKRSILQYMQEEHGWHLDH